MERKSDYNTDQYLYVDQEKGFTVGEALQFILAHWRWFAVSLAVCILLAALYFKLTPKVYERTASVLIKDNNKAGGLNESFVFDDFSMFKFKNNLDNEMFILKSERLMRETARRLKLNINYTAQDGLRLRELYTQSPVVVSLLDDELQEFSFIVTPLSGDKVKISDFSVDENDVELEIALNDTVNTPVGSLSVSPTLYYSDAYYNEPVTVNKGRFKDVVQHFRNSLQIELASEAGSIINISLKDMSVQRAEDVINTLIAVYNEDAINDKNQIAINTSDFINDRLIILERELNAVDSDIASYKSKNQLLDVSSEAGLYLERNSEFSKEGLMLENQRDLANYILQYVNEPQNVFELIPANMGIEGVNIESQIKEYNNLLLKRNRLVDSGGDNNPVVIDINNSIASLRQNIILSLNNYIVSLNLRIKTNRKQESDASRRISVMPEQQKNIMSVGREQKIKEELYLYLLGKREENALAQAITVSNARVIDSAGGQDTAISPSKMKFLAFALFAGLFLPIVILWIKYTMNTSIRSLKDVEQMTTAPILGEIPRLDKKDNRKIVIDESSNDSISEAFRIVRTNIDFMQTEKNNKRVIMFTSAMAGMGKTFISSNLALSFAFAKKKAILIDLDIRKNTMTNQYYMGDKQVGITNYLAGKVKDIDEIINPSQQNDYLDIIHSGPIPPNPAELLLSDNLDKLIEELKQRYEYVLIDNVPAGIVADSYIVNRIADMTVYVVRVGEMERRLLPDIEKLYRQNKFKNLFLIVNATQFDRKYGYSYGYGYGNK